MSDPGCERFADDLLDARSPSGLVAELSAHLGACADCRAQADAHFALWAKMHAVELAPPPAAWAAIAARVATPAPGFFERLFGEWRVPTLVLAGVCAALLVVVGGRSGGIPYRAGGSFTSETQAQAATGTAATGAALALAGDSWVELKPDAKSQVRVEGPATFKLASRARVELSAGHAVFDLGPQPDGFTVAVAGGEVRVIGTKFTVDASADVAQVSVEHGIVEVRPRTGAARRLEAGGHARLGADGVLRENAPVPTPVRSSSPTAPESPAPRPSIAPPIAATPASPPSIKAVRPGGRTQGGF